MVYPGQPSKGCGICRRRRVKCDERKPNCENCNKQGLSCSGYREWSELHIRNQTKSTVSRYTSPNDSTEATESASAFRPHTPPEISISTEDLALENFFINFVRPSDPASVHKGYFQVLPDLYSSASPFSPLRSAVSAFALATYRVDAASSNCISEGRAAYAVTLDRIQQEIHSDQRLASNETLLAILLMQVIEALLESGSIEAKPESHLDGAMTVVKMRGLGGFQDKTSQILLTSARAQGIMRSFGRSLGLETLFSKSNKDFVYTTTPLPDTTMSDRPFRSTGLLHQISQAAELLEIYNRAFHSEDTEILISNAQDLAERCKGCDNQLVQWAESAHSSWRRISVPSVTSKTSSFGAGLRGADIYSDVFIARSWNYYRVARIFIQIIVMRCIVHAESQDGPTYVKSLANKATPESSTFQRTLTDMVDDMCASVPFHLGRCNGHEWIATGIGAYFLIWPLLLAQEALPENSPQKTWILNQLLEISRSLGLDQSKITCKIQELSRGHLNS